MANRIAVLRNLLPEEHYHRMHGVLRKNYADFTSAIIPLNSLLEALMKDKKNTDTKLVLIFPRGEEARIERVKIAPDELFRQQCQQTLAEILQ